MSDPVAALLRRLEQATLVASALCVTAIMLIVCYDAAGRYIASQPLRWAFDLVTNYLLVAAAWLAVSATFTSGDHISIDLLHARLPHGTRVAADILCAVLAILVFGGITYGAAQHAREAWSAKEFYPGAVMWPVWLSYAPIPFGAGLLILRLAHHVTVLARTGDDPFVKTHSDGVSE